MARGSPSSHVSAEPLTERVRGRVSARVVHSIIKSKESILLFSRDDSSSAVSLAPDGRPYRTKRMPLSAAESVATAVTVGVATAFIYRARMLAARRVG